MFGFGHKFRPGGRVRLGPISSAPDLHRLGEGAQDYLGIAPPLARDWGQYQTFFSGNQIPGTGYNTEGVYTYGNMSLNATPGRWSGFNQLKGGAINHQVGSVTVGDILDRLRAAWSSTQGG